MREKSIKSVIVKKFNAWMESIEDKWVQDKVKEAISVFGENILVRKLVHYKKDSEQMGEFYSYIHGEGRVGVVVELLFEEERIKQDSTFLEFAKNITLQIASMGPVSISRENLPKQVVDEQKQILMKQASESGKPEKVLEKIVTGRLEKFFKDICLLTICNNYHRYLIGGRKSRCCKSRAMPGYQRAGAVFDYHADASGECNFVINLDNSFFIFSLNNKFTAGLNFFLQVSFTIDK